MRGFAPKNVPAAETVSAFVVSTLAHAAGIAQPSRVSRSISAPAPPLP